MSRLAKILKMSLLFVISVMIVLFSVSLFMQDKVAEVVIKTLNNNLATKINTGSFRFSLLRQFPNASVEMKNIFVHSSAGFTSSDFPEICTDTLLSAKSASVEIGLINLIKKDYSIARITIRSGRMTLLRDSSGKNNFTISSFKNNGSIEPLNLDLRRINLEDVRFIYADHKSDLTIGGTFHGARLKGNIAARSLLLTAGSEITFDMFRLKNFMLKSIIPSHLEIELHHNEYGTHFRKTKLMVDNWEILMTGSVFEDNDLDIAIAGKNIDIAKMSYYLPDKYKAMASDYRPRGVLELEGSVKGFSSASRNPHVELTFNIGNARVFHEMSKMSIDNLSFNGSFTNGSDNNRSTSCFEIQKFTASMGSGKYNGYFKLYDFSNPSAEMIFRGTVYADEMNDFLNLRHIKSAEGTIDLDIKLSGNMTKKTGYTFIDILALEHNSRFRFNSLGISLSDRNLNFEDINGNVLITDITYVDNLSFLINNQYIKFSGNFEELPLWLADNTTTLYGSGKISAPSLAPEKFMNTESVEKDGRVAPVFPASLNLDLDFSIDTLFYKKFSASDITGKLHYFPSVINFKTLTFKSQDGIISGNGLLLQNMDKSFIAKGSFTLGDVDINSTFNAFSNFGQDFIKSENLAGSLSGSVSVLLPLDSLFRGDKKGLIAEGRYLITRGALINFEPVKKLSSFIQLSELQNISFEELENDFFIRNNSLFIPQMDVRSSAVGLSVNGKHDFNNNYEYHVKMLLSEILSRKARKNKALTSEFGEIEDDGLGRTSVFLMIEGTDKDSKVTYDLKAAGNQIKSDIKKERENLGKILDEEYRYKSTYSSGSRPASKPRFRIRWEGSDTTNTYTEPDDVKKENIIKNIFKKKL